jgi:exosortase
MKKRPAAHRLSFGRRESAQSRQPKLASAPPVTPEMTDRSEIAMGILMGSIALFTGIWAYWPTLQNIVSTWEREPDYSHGYLVVPASLFFLWTRRKSLPQVSSPAIVTGFALVASSLLVRVFAAVFYYHAIDGWSMLIWLAGVVAIFFGNAVLRWAFPAIAFLFFMIPLPFSLEGAMSLPLQRIATKVSCWTLQLFGQPAISEGNTILLGDHRLEVEQACSGLRLFMSISALAFAYLLLVKRSWWEKLLLVFSIVPIAIVANAARIVATGLLFQYASSDVGKKFSHDFAGWAMIPLAAALFGMVLWYLGKLFQEQVQIALGDTIRRIEI